MIKFEGVSKSYDGKTNVVESVNFEIAEGEFFVLIGPSGCGKTTTLKMINRLIPLSDGTIRIQDKKISDYAIHELRWQIGYVLQQIALFPHMTIEENISIVPELKQWKKDRIHKRVTELLNMVGLDPHTYRGRKPSELSGGQQQRIGVVRALAADPDIVLMDEPFSALDPISRSKLQEDLLHLQRTIKKTIVFVTHDIQEAMKLGDRICIMKNGKIEQLGTPDEITAAPATPFVQEFIRSGGSQPFVIRDHMEPASEVVHIDATTLAIDAGWSKVLDALLVAEVVAIKENDIIVGMLSREALLAFLASQAKERTATA
ncbi:ABC transporter ATP-binding protein [Sporosarcina sp. BI001-red]|uniref:ABC transporter ATP-binding protein n=1 Tax=Sporosarcina sp. BI001-red TaxID=2282866 RepID=UPI000E278393|nr:ABC transporter ATP-binding protein [Sporosarcina sp. BI001-red]REB06076.1 ABC transporter ATP-binding protein [Sporosarcina sp. BI001-red]